MKSLAAALALASPLFSLLKGVSATTSTLSCPTADKTLYTDDNGMVYMIFCSSDTTTGQSGSTGTSSLALCLDYCDTVPGCVSVSWTTGGVCYWKADYTATTSSSTVNSAVLYSYIAPPPYPVPVANYANASSGCGTALSSGLTAGAGSVSMNFTSPDGRLRNYLINVPATYDVNKAVPLILVFHGKGESGTSMEAESGYSLAKWNPYGITIYPNGVNVSSCAFVPPER